MRRITGWLIILAFAGCTDHTKIPSGIIQKNKMEKIMWDMLQADRFATTFIITGKDTSADRRKDAAIFYERVFKINGITRDQFIRSYKFYLGRPDLTKVMFDSIAARAETRRAEVHTSKRNPLLQKRDSLRRADSTRRQDSIEALEDENSTETMSDSALKKALFK
jgi:hypothetical protein